MWQNIIYSVIDKPVDESLSDTVNHRKLFTEPVAKGILSDFIRINNMFRLADLLPGGLDKLCPDDRSFWYQYAEEVPIKLMKLNLFVRPYEEFCRTCIITDSEIDTLIGMDLEKYCQESSRSEWQWKEANTKTNQRESFLSTIKDWHRFWLELNCLIPVQLKKLGYELIRQEEAEEINMALARRLARIIHSRYLKELREQRSAGRDDPKVSADFGILASRDILALDKATADLALEHHRTDFWRQHQKTYEPMFAYAAKKGLGNQEYELRQLA